MDRNTHTLTNTHMDRQEQIYNTLGVRAQKGKTQFKKRINTVYGEANRT